MDLLRRIVLGGCVLLLSCATTTRHHYLGGVVSVAAAGSTTPSSSTSRGPQSSVGSSILKSPIKHWDGSYAASCAQGTAIAMRCLENPNCVLLVLRSPTTNIWRPANNINENDANSHHRRVLFGLPVRSIPRRQQPIAGAPTTVQFGPSWLSFENSLCAMTGLVSDVEHLSRVVQNEYNNHYDIYEESPTTFNVQRRISTVLQHRTLQSGSRPFGVQMLFVGCDDIDFGCPSTEDDLLDDYSRNTSDSVCLYSIDPSGSWQSWAGRGTAIGKYAPLVRKHLYEIITKNRKDSSNVKSNLRDSLKIALQSWKNACNEMNVNIDQDSEDYQVLVLWRDDDNHSMSHLGEVEDAVISEVLDELGQDQDGSKKT